MLSILSVSNALCMPFYFKARSAKENPIPHMVQIELGYISIQCRVIDPNVNRLFNSSGNVMALPAYYMKIVLGGGVACTDAMIMYGGFL